MSPKAQDKDGSTFSATLNSKPETNFPENMHPFIIVSVQQRAEKSQGQAARPLLDLLAYANTFALDLFTPTLETIRSVHEKAVGDWQQSQAGRRSAGP